MAPRGWSQIRLWVEIPPLIEEGVPEDKFTHSFQRRATIEEAQELIEKYYKKRHLDARQAAQYSIKKLQDGLDYDLPPRDTIRSLFGADADPFLRTIKVVHNDEPVSKRQRTKHSPDRPLPSTEVPPARDTTKRKDVYDMPSSPEQSQPRNSRHVHSETSLLNTSRLQPTPSQSNGQESRQAQDGAEQVRAVSEPFADDDYESTTLAELRRLTETRGLDSRGYTKTLIKRLREQDRKSRHAASAKSPEKIHAAKASSPATNEPPAATAHLNDDSWNVENHDQPTHSELNSLDEIPSPAKAHDHAVSDSKSDSGSDVVPHRRPDYRTRSRSGSAAVAAAPEEQEDDDMVDAEYMIQSQLNNHSSSAPEYPSHSALVVGSRSPSASAGASNRSSPAKLRKPARFLSHSPSSKASSSESGYDERERSETPAPPANEGEEMDSDGSLSSESTTDDEDEVEEDAEARESQALPSTNDKDEVEEEVMVPDSQALPSSPPMFPKAASQAFPSLRSSKLPMSASQPDMGRIHDFVPTDISKSSPPAFTQAAASHPNRLQVLVAGIKKPAAKRPVAKKPAVPKKPFNPCTVNLAKLAKGNVAQGGEGGDNDDDDEEDEEEDTSDDGSG